MSKRRKVGDVVRTKPGSGFGCPATVVKLIKLDPEYPWLDPCPLDCGDRGCREWANVEVVGEDNKHLFHISECEMSDLDAETEI